MNRIVRIFCVFALTAVFLGGCGDKERDLATYKWTSFQKAETERIKAAHPKDDLKPLDFNTRVVEVVGAPYRFKGFIGFKKGNTFQEASYAFVGGKWQPVAYGDLERDAKTQKEMETIREKLKELKEDISDKEEELEEYNSIFEKIETMKLEVQELEKRMGELKQKN